MRLAIATIAVLLVLASPASATEAYISPFGNDLADCSQSAPCKTANRAAQTMPSGGDIRTVPGFYAWQSGYTFQAAGMEFLHAEGSTINGLTCKNCKNLRILGGRWSGNLTFDGANTAGLRDAYVTPVAGAAIKIIGSQRVSIVGNELSGGSEGVSGTHTPNVSNFITIADNYIHGQTSDGIALGDYNDVSIVRNQIEDIKDPCPTGTNCIHNDGIQFHSAVNRALIKDNTILRARSQGIFLQPANGPIDDVTVMDNTVDDVFSVGLVLERITHAIVMGNRVCGGPESDGGIWLTDMTGYVAVGNVAGSIGMPQNTFKFPAGGVESGNVPVPGGC